MKSKKLIGGTYFLNTWAKNTSSSNKYDGWKLNVIKVNSDLMGISKATDISASVFKAIRYVLPKSVTVTLEDDSKKSKAVTWDTEVLKGANYTLPKEVSV